MGERDRAADLATDELADVHTAHDVAEQAVLDTVLRLDLSQDDIFGARHNSSADFAVSSPRSNPSCSGISTSTPSVSSSPSSASS